MSPHRPSASPLARTRPAPVVALVLATAVLAAVLGHASASTSTPTVAQQLVSQLPRPALHHRAGPGTDDGVVPDDVTVFDDRYPAVTRLDPGLLDALRRAAKDAAGDGVVLYVNSGWRSPAYQERLLDEAIAEYGSRTQAARWVATPTTSPHVAGEAVDIGHSDAATWLSHHGAAYGLCRVYGNEPWHFELRPRALTDGCPATYADPSGDPRLR